MFHHDLSADNNGCEKTCTHADLHIWSNHATPLRNKRLKRIRNQTFTAEAATEVVIEFWRPCETPSYDNLGVTSRQTSRIRRIGKHSTLTLDGLRRRIRFASHTISRRLINACRVILLPGNVDVPFLSPSWPPAVTYNPISWCVAYYLNAVVEVRTRIACTTLEYTTTIQHPWLRRGSDGDGPFSGHSG